MAEKEMKVSAIAEGTVIDHIPCENTFRIVRVLELEGTNDLITLGVNFQSKKMGRKGVIKIGGRFLRKDEIDKIALLAPEAVLNIIKDYQVTEKIRPEIPDVITGIVKCSNPNCVTNHGEAATRFSVISRKPLGLRCAYCERITGEGEIVLL
jgi:aspartate carbamoyltransferase regulatory subunit